MDNGGGSGCTRPAHCIVSRGDGKSVSAEQPACSFATVDAGGNATVVVPVDEKLKQ